jgi:hypothetical protein
MRDNTRKLPQFVIRALHRAVTLLQRQALYLQDLIGFPEVLLRLPHSQHGLNSCEEDRRINRFGQVTIGAQGQP